MHGKSWFIYSKNSSPTLLGFFGMILFSFNVLSDAGILIFDENESIDEFPDSELFFTRHIQKSGIEGPIVSAEPPDACSKISSPPDLNCSQTWMVLIAGNFCDYDTKIMNAELAGYTVAVIYNLRGKEIEPIKHKPGYFSNISAVTIMTSSGIIIRENYLYSIDKRYRMYIFPNTMSDIMTFLVLFVFVMGVFIIILLSFLIIRFVQQARSCRNACLSSQHLRQLRISTFQKGDPYETCAICLEDYKNKEKLRILPCEHGYHVKCIDPWLTKNRRICPICKQKVVVAGEFSGNGDESDTEIRAERTPLLQNISRPTSLTNYQAMTRNTNTTSVDAHSGDMMGTTTSNIFENNG